MWQICQSALQPRIQGTFLEQNRTEQKLYSQLYFTGWGLGQGNSSGLPQESKVGPKEVPEVNCPPQMAT